MTNYLCYHLFEGVCFGHRRRVAVLKSTRKWRNVGWFLFETNRMFCATFCKFVTSWPVGYKYISHAKSPFWVGCVDYLNHMYSTAKSKKGMNNRKFKQLMKYIYSIYMYDIYSKILHCFFSALLWWPLIDFFIRRVFHSALHESSYIVLEAGNIFLE
jgi:hypothetical protein